jgi:hypothetical protein
MLIVKSGWNCHRCDTTSVRGTKPAFVSLTHVEEWNNGRPFHLCRKCIDKIWSSWVNDATFLAYYWNAVREAHDKGLIRVED